MILIAATLSSCTSTTFSLQSSSLQNGGVLGNCDGYFHGAVIKGFTRPTAPCSEASRTCVNGSWSGPEIFSTCQ
ncbi:MAG: hypothetical protein K2Q18_07920 [Bdellovibrionales bacterium]|nr:hypothetical protein [Bdellovibrionales bacterium]